MKKQINPTRMELLKLKRKLKMAQRGYKLLKEKRDGLMKHFMGIIREAKELRQDINSQLAQGFKTFLYVSSNMNINAVKQALSTPTMKISLNVKTKNAMGVNVPKFTYQESGDPLCYSLSSTSSYLDTSLKKFSSTLESLVKLAEIEHSAKLLAEEIEKTRRRVNALEYVLIPDMQETIKYIQSKLDERERDALIALMKVKDIITQEN